MARSAWGPGNPYSKRPAGLTGAATAAAAAAAGTGSGAAKTWAAGTTGTGGVVAEAADCWTVVEVVVVIVCAGSFLSDRMMAAVTAAPVPALTAAMTAKVALDMLAASGGVRRRALCKVGTPFIPAAQGQVDKQREGEEVTVSYEDEAAGLTIASWVLLKRLYCAGRACAVRCVESW